MSTKPKPTTGGLRSAREGLGLSREALAHESGVSRSLIALVEAGYAAVSPENRAKLAAAVGLDDPDDLWPRIPDGPETPFTVLEGTTYQDGTSVAAYLVNGESVVKLLYVPSRDGRAPEARILEVRAASRDERGAQ